MSRDEKGEGNLCILEQPLYNSIWTFGVLSVKHIEALPLFHSIYPSAQGHTVPLPSRDRKRKLPSTAATQRRYCSASILNGNALGD